MIWPGNSRHLIENQVRVLLSDGFESRESMAIEDQPVARGTPRPESKNIGT